MVPCQAEGPRGEISFRPPGSRSEREPRLSVLCALRKLAEALGPFVYRGDVVVGEDGSMVMIDVNIWPSFQAMKRVGD